MEPRRAAGALCLLLLLTACGGGSPADSVPELERELSAIDDALSEPDYAEAQEHLETLVATAEDARAAGDLDDEDADRVLAAAARLLAELPAEGEPPAPGSGTSPEPSPSPSTEPTDDGTEEPGKSDEGKPPKPDKGKPDKDKPGKGNPGSGKSKKG